MDDKMDLLVTAVAAARSEAVAKDMVERRAQQNLEVADLRLSRACCEHEGARKRLGQNVDALVAFVDEARREKEMAAKRDASAGGAS